MRLGFFAVLRNIAGYRARGGTIVPSDDSDSSHPPRRNPPAKEKISSVKLFFFSVDLYHSQALLSRTPVIQKNFFMIQKTPDDTISVSSGACLHL